MSSNYLNVSQYTSHTRVYVPDTTWINRKPLLMNVWTFWLCKWIALYKNIQYKYQVTCFIIISISVKLDIVLSVHSSIILPPFTFYFKNLIFLHFHFVIITSCCFVLHVFKLCTRHNLKVTKWQFRTWTVISLCLTNFSNCFHSSTVNFSLVISSPYLPSFV